jgi:hypothetical protein
MMTTRLPSTRQHRSNRRLDKAGATAALDADTRQLALDSHIRSTTDAYRGSCIRMPTAEYAPASRAAMNDTMPSSSGPCGGFSCIAVGPVLLILAFFALFFGPSLALQHLFWQVSAEATPPGVWMTVQLDPAGPGAEKPGLMHGSLYTCPQA